MVNNYVNKGQERVVLNCERFMPNWNEGERTKMRRSTYLPIFDKGNVPLVFSLHNHFNVFRRCGSSA